MKLRKIFNNTLKDSIQSYLKADYATINYPISVKEFNFGCKIITLGLDGAYSEPGTQAIASID